MGEATTQGQMIKGEIAGTHPAKLVFNLLNRKRSGILAFDDGVTKIRLFFKNGCLIPSFDQIKKDKNFRRYLVRKRKATKDEMMLARKLGKEKKKNTIEVLIDKAILDRGTVMQEAENYYWLNAPSAFAWRHGTFTFIDNDFPKYEGDDDPSKTLQIIVEGIKTHYNQKMISHRLKKRMKTPIRFRKELPYSLDQFNLTEDERAFTDAIGHGNTLFDALGKTTASHAVIMALAFSLLTMGFLKFKAPAKKKAKGPSSALEAAMAAASESVDRIKEEVAAREDDVAEMVASGIEQPTTTEEELQKKLEQMYAQKDKPDGLEDAGDMDFNSDFGDDFESASDESDTDSFGEEDSFSADDEPETAATDEDVDFGFAEDEDLSFEEGELSFDDVAVDDEPEFGDINSFDEVPTELSFGPDDSPKDIYKLGQTYEDQSAYKVAAQAYEEAIARGLDTPEIRARLAWVTYNDRSIENSFEKGATMLQEIVKMHPNDHFPYLYLGKIYDAETDKNMAELYFIKALELNRDCEAAKNAIKRIHEN